MKFIVDAQLPPALARFLTAKGENAIHVLDKQMMESSDSEIWELALKESLIIITKDEDFQMRATVSATPPKIILAEARALAPDCTFLLKHGTSTRLATGSQIRPITFCKAIE